MSRRTETELDEKEEDLGQAEEETEEALASQVNRLQMLVIKKNLCQMIEDRGYLLPEEEQKYLEQEPEDLVTGEDPDFEMTYTDDEDEKGNPIGKILRTTMIIKTDNKAINKQDATDLIKIFRGEKGDPPVNTFIVISNVKAHRLGLQKLASLMMPMQTSVRSLREDTPFVQFLRLEDLLYNPTQHFYQSRFSILTEDERTELDADGVTAASLPVIKYSDIVDEVNETPERRKTLFCDPIVRYYGLRTAVILKEEAFLFAVSFLNINYLNFLITRR
jgi:hypothetical protein